MANMKIRLTKNKCYININHHNLKQRNIATNQPPNGRDGKDSRGSGEDPGRRTGMTCTVNTVNSRDRKRD